MRHPADRHAIALPELPGLGRSYLRTLAARGSRRSELERVEVRVDGVRIDAAHLAEYQRVLGEPVSDLAPAGYLFVLSFPLALSVMSRKAFPLRALGMVHVANRVVQNHPVRVGDSIGLRTWAQDLRAHRAGTQVDLVTQALDADGDVIWEQVSTFLAKGARLRGLEPADDESPRAEFSPPVPTGRWELPKDIGKRYAAVSGDRNPIHLNRLAAKAFGFPRTIAHGMYTAARALATVGPARGDSYVWEVSFARPVLIPSTVAVRVASLDAEPAPPPRNLGTIRSRVERKGAAPRGFEIALWDPRSGKPHLTGSVTPLD